MKAAGKRDELKVGGYKSVTAEIFDTFISCMTNLLTFVSTLNLSRNKIERKLIPGTILSKKLYWEKIDRTQNRTANE